MNSARLTLVLGLLLLLGSLANGSVSYLKRIGLMDRPFYESYMVEHCARPGLPQDSLGARCMCMHPAALLPGESKPASAGMVSKPGYVYENNTGTERGIKLLKDLLFGGFIIGSLWLLIARRSTLPSHRAGWPVTLFSLDLALGLTISMALWGWGFALLGLRGFAFLPVAILGAWAVVGLPRVAQCMAVLLLLETLLVLIELGYGIPLRTCPYSFRVAGTMVLPNSLGVLIVVALAFYSDFAKTRPLLPLLLVATVVVLIASGSGVGMVALLLWLAAFTLQRMVGPARWVVVVATALLGVTLAAALPWVTNRPDIYDSLFAPGGRVEKIQDVVRAATPAERILGQGIGYGTNTTANLADLSVARAPSVSAVRGFYADSTVTMLFTQLGLIGVASFYLLLGWAFWRDRAVRLFYLVIAVTSLTMNLMELFPVNFLLGLALAHSLAVSARGKPAVRAA